MIQSPVSVLSMSLLKRKKPGNVDGTRDQFVVNSWLFQMKQYLTLIQVENNAAQLDDPTIVTFASSLFTGVAAIGGIIWLVGTRFLRLGRR